MSAQPVRAAAATSVLFFALAASGCDRDTSGGRAATSWAEDVSAPDAARREAAVTALRKIGRHGRAATPTLLTAGTSADSNVRAAALRGLGAITADDSASLAALSLALTSDSSARVRSAAADALGAILADARGPRLDQGVRALGEALMRDGEAGVRVVVVGVLASLGERARGAAAALQHAARDSVPLVQHEARDALAHIYRQRHEE